MLLREPSHAYLRGTGFFVSPPNELSTVRTAGDHPGDDAVMIAAPQIRRDGFVTTDGRRTVIETHDRIQEDSDPPKFSHVGSEISALQRRLRDSGHLALRDIDCTLEEGVLRLRGRLSSFYLKQIALAIAHESEGIRAVDSQLVVSPTARSWRATCWSDAVSSFN